MASLPEVVSYLAEHYPHKSELSKARLTKMVYLADWESVKRNGKQLTPIKWYFHNFGPYVDDVVQAAKQDPRLTVKLTKNMYGDYKEEIEFSAARSSVYDLAPGQKQVLDSVIEQTKSMYWQSFINHVYSTPPVKKSQRYTYLDLVSFK